MQIPMRVQLPEHCELLVNACTSNTIGISISGIVSSSSGGGVNKRESIIAAFAAVAVVAW